MSSAFIFKTKKIKKGNNMEEYRVYGSPGCGKTYWLANKGIPGALKKYPPESIMVTSFSKAAAKVLTSRIDGIDQKNIGTLHSICHRALGSPVVAETKIGMWNSVNPHWHINGASIGQIDGDGVEGIQSNSREGEELLQRMNCLRGKLIPKKAWPEDVQHFAKEWQQFKDETGYVDFTDLLETAAKDMPYAPNNPNVMFIDEAQDLNPLQLKICRQWGMHMDYYIVVGDDDQVLYSWLGATAEAFLTPDVDEDHKRKLKQSYRVPKAVLQRAMKLIKQVSKREPKEYAPRKTASGRTVKGICEDLSFGYKNTDALLEHMQWKLEAGRQVMILTSCSYMLNPILAALKSEGIPFHNPYQIKNVAWNPLARGENKKVLAMDLLDAFFGSGPDENYWTVKQFITWAKYITVGPYGLQRGKGNKLIKKLEELVQAEADGLQSTRNVLTKILSDNALTPALDRDIDWLMDVMQAKRLQGMEFPTRVIKRHGKKALTTTPLVILSTIHSSKGSERTIVYLAPDISAKAYEELEYGASQKEVFDNLCRQFYVGMTRASEELYLLAPSSSGRRKSGLFFNLTNTL